MARAETTAAFERAREMATAATTPSSAFRSTTASGSERLLRGELGADARAGRGDSARLREAAEFGRSRLAHRVSGATHLYAGEFVEARDASRTGAGDIRSRSRRRSQIPLGQRCWRRRDGLSAPSSIGRSARSNERAGRSTIWSKRDHGRACRLRCDHRLRICRARSFEIDAREISSRAAPRAEVARELAREHEMAQLSRLSALIRGLGAHGQSAIATPAW